MGNSREAGGTDELLSPREGESMDMVISTTDNLPGPILNQQIREFARAWRMAEETLPPNREAAARSTTAPQAISYRNSGT